ncbi:uncharacterized protein TNCV_3491631 [Trichonephila clavipes]|nr:uncharacterized protein TNCV_3491631 [Trichonephila clavipes]
MRVRVERWSIHSSEVCSNSTSEQIHLGKDHLLTIVVSGYKTSVENVMLSPPFQHIASPDDSRTSLTVCSLDVTGMKPYHDVPPNQLALRIACGTEMTLIHKEDMTPLMRCPVFVLLTPLQTVPPMTNFQRNAAFRTADE